MMRKRREKKVSEKERERRGRGKERREARRGRWVVDLSTRLEMHSLFR